MPERLKENRAAKGNWMKALFHCPACRAGNCIECAGRCNCLCPTLDEPRETGETE